MIHKSNAPSEPLVGGRRCHHLSLSLSCPGTTQHFAPSSLETLEETVSLSCLSAAGRGWLNRYARNISAYSCITLQNDFSFLTLWRDKDCVNWTGRILLLSRKLFCLSLWVIQSEPGESLFQKEVHALFPLRVFHNHVFSMSPLTP